MTADLVDVLTAWLPRQRWFAGKGRQLDRLEVVADTPVRDDDPALRHLIVRSDYVAGPAEHYQVLVGIRPSLPSRLEPAAMGDVADGVAYDALHDPELCAVLLAAIAAGQSYGDIRLQAAPGRELNAALPSRLVGAEQSNSSVVFGDSYILKVFRKLAPGLNPDLELTRALAELGSQHIAEPLGWMDGPLAGDRATLGLLQTFLQHGSEGWALATASVRDLFAEGDLHADEVGGDFAAESERLGAATAAVHADLARALGTAELTRDDLTTMARGMRDRLREAIDVVPELSAYDSLLSAAYDAVEQHEGAVVVQRIHGDYHLGQVIRTLTGWVLLDFEGEPARPLAERRSMASPLRDVAGMLRSYDYAARHLLADHVGEPGLAYRATEWAERNRGAFCAGYASAAGSDPREHRDLLRGFEVDKAVYEVVYEARHRPAWLAIPLGSLERLAAAHD